MANRKSKSKSKFSALDVMLVLAFFLALLVIGLSWDHQPYLGSKNMLVTVRINDAGAIDNISAKMSEAKKVCIDSQRYCAEQVSSMLVKPADGEANYVVVIMRGLGDVKDSESIFLGHRISANQEVQLRGDYVADGYVTDFYYED